MIKPDPDCPNCNKAGLAILPVRYAVLPKGMSAKLPAALKAPQVKTIALQHHQYALRTLRAGFIYVFHEKRWRFHPIPELAIHFAYEVYSVNEKGFLSKQLSAVAARSIENEKACSQESHYVPTSVIAIKNPEKAGIVWIAFSEHKWSRETLEEYGKDAKLRAQRMQKIEPAKLIGAPEHDDGFVATVQSLKEIVEYRDTAPTAVMPPIVNAKFSKDDGDYDQTLLKSVSTLYPVEMRTEVMAKDTIEFMQAIGQASVGKKPNAPLVLALWDGIGITHELSGYRNEPAGRIQQYGQERELEISALNAIEGVKKTLEEKTAASADAQIKTAHSLPKNQDLENRATRARLIYRYEPEKLNAELQAIDQERARRAQASKAGAERFKKDQIAAAWPKYEAKLNTQIFDLFKKNHSSFLDAAAKVIDDRTDDLMAWLESQALIDALTEYHPKNINDGVAFEDKVGEAMFGIGSSEKGAKKLAAWVKEAKATQQNLLWRAIALNQKEGIDEVNAAMAAAVAARAPIGQLSVDFLTTHVRKWADMYKKTNTMENTLAKAGNAAEGIKRIKVTGIDRLFLTAGDKLFAPFIQRGVDTGAEFAVRGLMLARAGVEPDRIMDAIKAQAKEEGLARAAIVRRLQAAKGFIGAGTDFKEAKFADLEKKWKDLKANETKGLQAIKENRLSLVVATLEIINLTKIGWEFGHDKRTYGELAAAAGSATAAVFDIAANAAKHLVGDKVSVTFQMLKVSGGILSAGAGYYSMVSDGGKSLNNWEREKYALAISYGFKSASQFGATTLGLLASISYAAPLMEASSSKIIQATGSRLLLYRLFCMTWAVRLNMVGIGIQLFIWVFTDDDLQNWCEECPFGIHKDKGIKDPKKQLEKLGESLQSVM